MPRRPRPNTEVPVAMTRKDQSRQNRWATHADLIAAAETPIEELHRAYGLLAAVAKRYRRRGLGATASLPDIRERTAYEALISADIKDLTNGILAVARDLEEKIP